MQLRDYAYLMIILFGVGYIFYVGKSIIMPLVFGLFLAVLLTPIHRWITRFIKIKWLSIIISILFFLVPISIIALMISMQMMAILDSLPSIGENLIAGLNKIIDKAYGVVPSMAGQFGYLDSEDIALFITKNIGWLQEGLIAGSNILFFIGMVFIYAFFLLLYKDSYKQFIVNRYRQQYRPEVQDALNNIKVLIQKYLIGVGMVMLILAVVNSIGLFIIGIKYAVFWGVLVGILAIIPYIGTFIGGALPFIFALATTNTTWQPLAIIGFYILVQQLEGNFITPKIVGNQVNINPLISIVGLLVFGIYWGIGGIILALPVISIFKLIFEHFEVTEPISQLMGTEFSDGIVESNKDYQQQG